MFYRLLFVAVFAFVLSACVSVDKKRVKDFSAVAHSYKWNEASQKLDIHIVNKSGHSIARIFGEADYQDDYANRFLSMMRSRTFRMRVFEGVSVGGIVNIELLPVRVTFHSDNPVKPNVKVMECHCDIVSLESWRCQYEAEGARRWLPGPNRRNVRHRIRGII